MPSSMEQLDLVIVGAGWYGLVMASTYLRVNPSHSVVLFTNGATLGGAWVKDRLYPNLRSNNLLGALEYSDFPMSTERYGVKPGEHIPGEVIYQYLSDYAEHYDLTRRVRVNSHIEVVEEGEDGIWILTVRGTKTGEKAKVRARRLVMATGMASIPNIPDIPGSETFGKPAFHSCDFGKNVSTLNTAKSVCITGSAKSGWDAAYDYAMAGVQVEWVIRKSSLGPSWMTPVYVTPLKKSVESLVFARLIQWFSPCIWSEAGGYSGLRWFLHETAIGRFLTERVWWVLENDLLTLNKYDRCEETKVLKPSMSSFHVGSMLSLLNYPTDFFDLVKEGKIRIHLADIEHISPGTLHLSNGQELMVDAIFYASGWKSDMNIKFEPESLKEKLGCPTARPNAYEMTAKADAEILRRFPSLGRQPETIRFPEDSPSWRLFRFVVPPAYLHKRSVGFSGMLTGITTAMHSQTQALWLTAYFSGMDLSQFGSVEDVAFQTELENRFGRWRCPQGFGVVFPDFVFDSLPYVDHLIRDLGLNRWRKKTTIAEIFEQYKPADYNGLVDEWIELNGSHDAINTGDIAPKGSAELRKRQVGIKQS